MTSQYSHPGNGNGLAASYKMTLTVAEPSSSHPWHLMQRNKNYGCRKPVRLMTSILVIVKTRPRPFIGGCKYKVAGLSHGVSLSSEKKETLSLGWVVRKKSQSRHITHCESPFMKNPAGLEGGQLGLETDTEVGL